MIYTPTQLCLYSILSSRQSLDAKHCYSFSAHNTSLNLNVKTFILEGGFILFRIRSVNRAKRILLNTELWLLHLVLFLLSPRRYWAAVFWLWCKFISSSCLRLCRKCSLWRSHAWQRRWRRCRSAAQGLAVSPELSASWTMRRDRGKVQRRYAVHTQTSEHFILGNNSLILIWRAWKTDDHLAADLNLHPPCWFSSELTFVTDKFSFVIRIVVDVCKCVCVCAEGGR